MADDYQFKIDKMYCYNLKIRKSNKSLRFIIVLNLGKVWFYLIRFLIIS